MALNHPRNDFAKPAASDMLNTLPRLRIVLVLLLGGLIAMPAAAQPNDSQAIRTMLQQRDRDLKQAVRPLLANPQAATAAQRQRVADLINGVINFEEMSRQALGPFWKDLSAAQRADFVAVFTDIVRAQSLADLDIYNATVTYDAVRVVGDSAYVRTTTVYQDKPAKVEYYLGQQGEAWLVHNVVLDDVGTVEGYQRSFQSVIRKRGFDVLMQSLRKKQAKLQAARS